MNALQLFGSTLALGFKRSKHIGLTAERIAEANRRAALAVELQAKAAANKRNK